MTFLIKLDKEFIIKLVYEENVHETDNEDRSSLNTQNNIVCLIYGAYKIQEGLYNNLC